MKNTARKELRKRLKFHGMSIKDFSEKHGFKYNTVTQVITRYWGKTDKEPVGMKTFKILETLKSYKEGGDTD